MYAIIEDSGSQVFVREGDVIKIDTRDLAEDAVSVTFDRVLMLSSENTEGDSDAKVGTPLLAGATVEADILEEGRDAKVEVVKFKRRKTYVRRNGHRQGYVKVKITKIAG